MNGSVPQVGVVCVHRLLRGVNTLSLRERQVSLWERG